MNLYVVRHADALPAGGVVSRDFDRRLSPRGEEDAELMGRALAQLDPNVNIVVTSPLVRAVETGEIIARQLSDHPITHVSTHLAPGFNNNTLFAELLALSAGSSIVAIGHQPDVGTFISSLITGGDDAAVAMSPGSIAKLVLEGTRPSGYLSWLLTPETVKALHAGL